MRIYSLFHVYFKMDLTWENDIENFQKREKIYKITPPKKILHLFLYFCILVFKVIVVIANTQLYVWMCVFT